MTSTSRTLLESVYHLEQTRADAVYLTQPVGHGATVEFSWSRTVDEARRVAAHLRSLELPPRSNIAILSKNCAHFIMTDLAIWMAGHVSVALYPTLNAQTVQYILEHSESKLLFVGKLDSWEEMQPGVPADLPCISYPLSPPTEYPTWNDIIAAHEPIDDSPTRPDEDMAIIVYTSGSTGRPKGVMMNFGAMAKAGRAIAQTLSITQDERMLSYLPLAHVMERWLVETVSLLVGVHVFFADTLDTFVEDLQRAEPTLFVSVPRLWMKFQAGVFSKMPAAKLELLLRIPILSSIVRKKVLKGLGLQSVRFAGSGSAPIPGSVIEWYRKLGLELLEGYGMTENFAYSHVSMPGKSRVGYVGNTYPGVEHRIGDDGEILVKSPGDMMGYYKEPEMTRASFTDDGFFKTGDQGEIDAEGRLRITGRTKEIFKCGKGKYIAPAPIENLLNAHDHLEMSCVTGAGMSQPFALVQLSEALRGTTDDDERRAEVKTTLRGLLDRVNAALEHHERLQFLVVVTEEWTMEAGLLTPTLKIKRQAVEDRYAANVEGWYDQNEAILWA
jgi:long-chain acyl-CoA synthetase